MVSADNTDHEAKIAEDMLRTRLSEAEAKLSHEADARKNAEDMLQAERTRLAEAEAKLSQKADSGR